jgi:hypothetical protein
MLLAGYPIAERDVLELAVLLRRADYAQTADTLEGAVAANQPDVALTISDRAAILRALDEPPSKGLAALRSVLLREHVGRVRDGRT